MPFAVLNGARLWFDDWGATEEGGGEVEPLVFLHGFTAYRRMWGHGEGGAAWLLAHQTGLLHKLTRPSPERYHSTMVQKNDDGNRHAAASPPPPPPPPPPPRYRCIFLEARGLNESKAAPGM